MSTLHTAFVALGANLGQRALNIKEACGVLRQLSRSPIATSFLYETPPAYVLDQPSFLNAVVKITTDLGPERLLEELKHLESKLGRVKTRRFGERAIDMDIVLFDDVIMDTTDLTIPHPRMQEREFVLRPICDIAPHVHHPVLKATMATLLSRIVPDPSVTRVLPLNPSHESERSEISLQMGRKTRLMGVLNVTPDSFTDGGEFFSLEKAVEAGKRMAGVMGDGIIDIGGQSTRPGAELVGPETEIQRVVPVIRALRSAGVTIPISVDTFHSSVAKAAIEAGADIINDVTGGQGDPLMLQTAASLDVPIILMHMRGDPATMNKMNGYEGNDVISAVRAELAERVEKALEAGICRWNIVVDPGLGFAKTGEHNLQLLRNAGIFLDGTPLAQYPMLMGPSRKKFLGTLAGKVNAPANERDWGTAAAVSACVAGGVDLVRVHNVDAMADVLAVANAIWRPQQKI